METHGMGYFYPFHWFWMIVWILFWVSIIVGLFFIIRSFMGNRTGDQKSAVDILKERYAKGEISKDEFLEKKKDLSVD